jgi:hypothetical protein
MVMGRAKKSIACVACLLGCAPAIEFHPPPGTTWQWQLSDRPVDRSFSVAVYDIDLFDNDEATIAALHDDGRTVLCYFSAGTWEPFRDDAEDFPSNVIGSAYEEEEFADERYVDVRSDAVRSIIQRRLDVAQRKGCDGVEPDNVDLHDHDTGFPISADDNLDFNRFLAREAHARGLSVGLKNNSSQLAELVGDFDWALNESCFSFDECALWADTFIAAGKAVFHAEYVSFDRVEEVCAVTTPLRLSTILKNIELDAAVAFCP